MVVANKVKENLPVFKEIGWREYEAEYDSKRQNMKPPSYGMLGSSIDPSTGEIIQGIRIDHFFSKEENGEKVWKRLSVLYDKDYVASRLYTLIEDCGLIRDGKRIQPAFDAWFDEGGLLDVYASTEGAKRQEMQLLEWAKAQHRNFPSISVERWVEIIRAERAAQAQDESESVEPTKTSNGKKTTAKV